MAGLGGGIDRSTMDVQRIIKVLGSSIRREILWRIWAAELPVAAILAKLDISGPTLSVHLAALRDAGLVTMRKAGTTRYYRARPEAMAGVRRLFNETDKWSSGREYEEQEHALGSVQQVVVVTAEAACSVEDAFRAFTDAKLYSAFMQGVVTIDDGRFAASLGIGQEVRGTYLHTAAPSLIVMEWDFHFKDVPIPGELRRAHLIITPTGSSGCRLEITQFIASSDQEPYMTSAWRYVLGCFSERIGSVLRPATR
jgi:DNA-binding transcriptional ArsR family regulator